MSGLVGGRLAEIRERLAAATPGPWHAKDHVIWSEDEDAPPSVAFIAEWNDLEQLRADAEFIAAAPADIADLTAALLAVLALANEADAEGATVHPMWIRRAVAAHLDPGAT